MGKVVWSPPVEPQRIRHDGCDSERGKAGGTAVAATVPIRSCCNPKHNEWRTSTRVTHTICQLGSMHIQVVAVYGLQHSAVDAEAFTNSLLTMVHEQVQSVPLPFVIAGDFNIEPQKLPIWEQFAHQGCRDLISLHQRLYDRPMPDTCLDATRPDGAIISALLVPYIHGIEVIQEHWFATHSPVIFSIRLPHPQMYIQKLPMPRPWTEFGLSDQELALAEQSYTRPHSQPTSLQQWAENFEALVDHAIRTKHQEDAAFPPFLPKSHRGRCKPRTPVKQPILSGTKPGRYSDFDPGFEVITISSRKKVKQARRVQSLLRRLKSCLNKPPSKEHIWEDLHREWLTILHSRCFKCTFVQWISMIPELGWPSYHLPDVTWLHELNQHLQHQVQAAVAQDHLLFSKKRAYATHCDARFNGKSMAFAAVRPPPAPPITELVLPTKMEAELLWETASKKVVCVCDPRPFSVNSQVSIQDQCGWIIDKDDYHMVVQFAILPTQRFDIDTATLHLTSLFNLTIDWDKTWCWAVDTETADAIIRCLSDVIPHAVQRKHHSRDLGLEIQYSGAHTNGHRVTRWDQGFARLQRLQAHNLPLSVKEHVLSSSIFASMFYGAEIFPCNPDLLAKARSKAADALLGHTPSLTPAIALLLTKPAILDPGFYVIMSALRQAIAWLRTQDHDTCMSFFARAASFVGHTSAIKGPAASLSVYLSRIDWQIDKQGYVQVDTFIKLHLVKDSFQHFVVFLQLAWQNHLVITHTNRQKMFHLPDISRVDTVAVLAKFNDKDRQRLLKEIAKGFQEASQKLKWAEDEEGTCPFCHEEDTYHHRLYTCAAFQDTRQPFQDLIQRSEDYGSCFDEVLAILVNPMAQMCRTLHYQEPWPEIPVEVRRLAQQASESCPLHIFTDGSCVAPSYPSTRYAAYACVVDLSPDDAARQAQVQQWCATGKPLECFQTFAMGRTCGEQTINRAELSALIVCGDLGEHVHLHTDSAYAISTVQKEDVTSLPSPSQDGNLDLRLRMRDSGLTQMQVHKVKAHTTPSPWDPWWDIFCALGNAAADAAAASANSLMREDWATFLRKRHEDLQEQRSLFHDTCQLVLQLNNARAAAAQQAQLAAKQDLVAPDRFSPLDIQHRLANWTPEECQQLVFPDDIEGFSRFFSWGDYWMHTMLHWLQQFSWPSSPGGPLSREVGISWLELGLSLSMFAQRLLPIHRKESCQPGADDWCLGQHGCPTLQCHLC
eukprot:Skav222490  [mRNA]  locus=scaffold1835:167452:172077:- [translate_table: standard]